MKKIFLAATVLVLFSNTNYSQRKMVYGSVCGDPTQACKARASFPPNDLPIDFKRNAVIFESEYFYAIVLKSAKQGTSCENLFPENERLDTQKLFPHNMVFAVRCGEAGENYYTKLSGDFGILGVFAGRTLSEAMNFLKAVKATNKFPGVKVRRTRAGQNGT